MSESIKSYCNKCAGETNHSILYEKENGGSEDFPEDGYSVQWGSTHRMIQCCGCDSISMRKDSWFSENADEHGRPYVDITYFPPRIYKQAPQWLDSLEIFSGGPKEVEELLKEVYVCLGNNCPRSAAMGCRALLERIFISEAGDQGSFDKNLNAFEGKGKISEVQKNAIKDVLEAGHASIHRGFKPSHEDLGTIVSIVENLIEVIYVHQNKSTELRKRIPGRVKKN